NETDLSNFWRGLGHSNTRPMSKSKQELTMTIDYTKQLTASATMDRETLREYERVIDPRLITKDHLGKPTSLPSVFGQSPGTNAPNCSPPVPLKVEGVEHVDRIADHFAKLDRRDLKQRLGVKDDPEAA